MSYPIGTGDFAAIVDVLKEKRDFLFLLHVQPDGDSIGSTLALGLALAKWGKKVTMVKVDDLPELYSFLPGLDRFVSWQEVKGEFDAVIFLDCGALDRTGEAAVLAERAKVKINVDHHVTNAMFGDLNYVDPRCSAVGEQVYQLLHAAEYPLDEESAVALYTSIATDTGNFRYENTTVDSHLITAHLMTFGVEPNLVSQAIYDNKSVAGTLLLAKALETLEVSADGLVASVLVSQDMYRDTGSTPQDTEGFVGFPRGLKGVEVGLMFRELENGQVRVALRSRGQVDVSRVAQRWAGGGHPRAAGCHFPGGLAEARKQVTEESLRAAREAQALAPVR